MRVFYLIYENYDDGVIPFVESMLKDCHLKEVGTVKSNEEDFRTVVHSWEKYTGWDWLKEMPRGKNRTVGNQWRFWRGAMERVL
jgi:hypothetical protein